MKRRNAVLIGFAGSGKSTVGKALSERFSWKFVDTDQLIVEQLGMPIKDIFARKGEAAFRALECEVIDRVLEDEHQVVATGGGAVLAQQSRGRMKEGGMVIALTATFDTILKRVGFDPNRPMVQGDAARNVRTLMESRKHAYDFADATIDTTDLSVQEIVEKIVLML